MMDEWLMQGIPRTIAENPDMGTVRRIRESVTSDTGQMVESDLLLPCPFCGGEAIYGKSEASGRVRAVCVDCLASTDWLAGTDEADAAWNRRSERTAFIEVSHGSHGPEPRFPGDVWTMHHVCSACGGPVDRGDRYCRNCGARLADNDKEEA